MTKSIFTSKTFWFGALQIGFGIVGLVFNLLDHETAITLIGTGFASIGFRTVTSNPVSLTGN